MKSDYVIFAALIEFNCAANHKLYEGFFGSVFYVWCKFTCISKNGQFGITERV